MFRSLQPDGPGSAACIVVEALVREHFALMADETVTVSEREGSLPGFPPWETLIAFWTDLPDGSTQRHHCKVFKPASEVAPDDLPPYWMKDALAVPPDWACACC